MKNIIIDTCFWIAYFEQRDNNHKNAVQMSKNFNLFTPEISRILFPFPTMYEFLNTRFSKNKNHIINFEDMLKQSNVEFIFDENYRDDILQDYIDTNKANKSMSLVDMVINRMIEDDKLRINYLISYNAKDFYQTCNNKRVEILPKKGE